MNMVICPPVWIRPEMIARVDKGILFAVLTAFLFSGAAMLVGLLLHRIMQGKGYKTHLAPCLAVPGLAALAGVLRFGLSVTAVQGVFLACLLLYASCSDLTDHHMDDHIWVTGLCSVGRFGNVAPHLFNQLLVDHSDFPSACKKRYLRQRHRPLSSAPCSCNRHGASINNSRYLW